MSKKCHCNRRLLYPSFRRRRKAEHKLISADDIGGILGNAGDPAGPAGGIRGSRAAQSRANRRTNTVEAAVARHQAQLAANEGDDGGSRMSGYNSARSSNVTG